jgi:hypothetical protein
MMRLVKRGLMFGNLIEVNSPALVGRYNRALHTLIGKETKLTEFHMDISGYSPEIGDEFGDNFYLNPKGCNRQFILLTTDQKTAPLLRSHFSTSRSILRNFIDENEEELFALTAREAVAGELLNSVFEVSEPKDLFQINQINIEADTIESHVAEGKALQKHVDTFMNKEDAWWDDVLIAQMIEMAKRTGNIQRNPIKLDSKTYTQGNYYTNHFGGIYVLRDVDKPTIIYRDPDLNLADLPVENSFHISEHEKIAKFFYKHRLTELIVSSPNKDRAAILKQKLDFITIATAANAGDDLGNLTRQQIQKITRKYGDELPDEYHGLQKMWRWANYGAEFPEIKANHPAYFYAFRASQHNDRDLINMILAELTPLDFRQLFICHKDAFYTAYQGWSDAKKDYVARFLADEYAVDKVGARETLFGSEPGMEEEENGLEQKLQVDPWGEPIKFRWKQ